MSIHEQLVAARNYIAKNGWNRGWGHGWTTKQHPTCIVGSLSYAVGSSYPIPVSIDASKRIHKLTKALGFNDYCDAIRWNDILFLKSGKDTVLARLDKAIAKTAPEPVEVKQLESTHEYEL